MATTQIAPGLSVDEIYQIVGSLGIAHIIKEHGVTEAERLGAGEAREGDVNSRCTFWYLRGVGFVASTNGDPVWESDEGFYDLAERCGVDLA